MDIDDIDLSRRTLNCLKAAGITTVEELRTKSDSNLLKLPLLGAKCLAEIRDVIQYEPDAPPFVRYTAGDILADIAKSNSDEATYTVIRIGTKYLHCRMDRPGKAFLVDKVLINDVTKCWRVGETRRIKCIYHDNPTKYGHSVRIEPLCEVAFLPFNVL